MVEPAWGKWTGLSHDLSHREGRKKVYTTFANSDYSLLMACGLSLPRVRGLYRGFAMHPSTRSSHSPNFTQTLTIVARLLSSDKKWDGQAPYLLLWFNNTRYSRYGTSPSHAEAALASLASGVSALAQHGLPTRGMSSINRVARPPVWAATLVRVQQ